MLANLDPTKGVGSYRQQDGGLADELALKMDGAEASYLYFTIAANFGSNE